MHRSFFWVSSLWYLFGYIQMTPLKPIQIKKISVQERDTMKRELRFIAGIRANPSDFPYRAALEIPYGSSGEISACEGSLIGPLTVMTAATCMAWYMPPNMISSLKVNLNTSYFWGGDAGSISVNASGYLLHPNFTINNVDLALVYLSSPVTTIKPLALPCTRSNFDGSTGVIAGWGPPARTLNRMKYEASLDPMMKANMTVLSLATCRTTVPSIEPPHMCVVAQGKDTLCEGGIGETLVVNGIAAGVASQNYGCSSNSTYPSFFTNVSSVVPWIKSNMKHFVFN